MEGPDKKPSILISREREIVIAEPGKNLKLTDWVIFLGPHETGSKWSSSASKQLTRFHLEKEIVTIIYNWGEKSHMPFKRTQAWFSDILAQRSITSAVFAT